MADVLAAGSRDLRRRLLVTSGQSLLLGLLAAGCLVGCARITPDAGTTEVSTVQLRPGDYDRLDYVRGEDCVGRYAIFFRLCRRT